MTEFLTEVNLVEEQRLFNQQLETGGALIDGKYLLPVSLSPYLIDYKKYTHIAHLCRQVINAIEKLLHLYVENNEIKAYFPELSKYRHLSCIKPLYRRWVHIARFDIVETVDGQFKLLETNCDCPGGVLFTSLIRKAFEHSKIYSLLNENIIYRQPIEDENFFINSLVSVYKELKGTIPSNIAFLSSKYRQISSDLNIFEKVANELGFNSKHITIQDLQLKNNRVAFDNFPIDIAYQKFDAFIDTHGQAKPCIYEQSSTEVTTYWQGIMERQMLTFNSFPSMLVAENKRILSLLQEPSLRSYFTVEENHAIDMFCLPTFFLDSTCSDYKRRLQDVIYKKDKYVIKSNIDTRGRGVWIGNQYGLEEWKKIVHRAINKPYVVQEYVPHRLDMIYDTSSNPTLVNMYSNLGMFIVNGEPCGLLARASKDIVTNVGKSGCMRPVCVIREKEMEYDH